MRRAALLFGLALIGVSCHKKTDASVPMPPVPIQAYEYEVYRFIMNDFDDTSRYKVVEIIDTTLPTDPIPEKLGTFRPVAPGTYTPNTFITLSAAWPGFNTDKFRSFFESANSLPYKIAVESLKVSNRIRPMGRRIVHSPADSVHWSKGKLLRLWFSRVALDSSGIEALLYSEHGCGYTCGAGQWFWLKKLNNAWAVYKSLSTWAS